MRWRFPSLRGYQRSWLTGDVMAGLTVWAVLVLEALAYASIAGVSPVVGLYAAPGALILYAALGSSRQLGRSDGGGRGAVGGDCRLAEIQISTEVMAQGPYRIAVAERALHISLFGR